jgi:hypothetical protein
MGKTRLKLSDRYYVSEIVSGLGRFPCTKQEVMSACRCGKGWCADCLTAIRVYFCKRVRQLSGDDDQNRFRGVDCAIKTSDRLQRLAQHRLDEEL